MDTMTHKDNPLAYEFFTGMPRREGKTLEELFENYGVRHHTLAKMSDMGFTVNTLIRMTEQELDEVIQTMVENFHIELLFGERYGVKAAIRAEKKAIEDEAERQRIMSFGSKSEKKRKLEGRSLAASKEVGKKRQKRRQLKELGEDGEDRPREHPFIVSEPGDIVRGKKNGLDYLFDLYEQCGKFLVECQQISKEKGEKCPIKVTNQVFRHAKHAGAGYINKPKMRHYVHCYALHCLDTEQSNAIRKVYKERGENVGAWRQACYWPLVSMARANGWDIEGLFNRNERLKIWYVPTKLRQLCHFERTKHGE
ncbi:unnamed protein product [Sphagnum jensenii]|uniref:Floricaula/leafy-like transcription factor n=1 Tax=Sphagnum jensenii TaxID=128206 RepID=A0ABP0VK26_9BRYO